MENLVTLHSMNTKVLFVSTRNNLIVEIINPTNGDTETAIIHKKYFNQIFQRGEVSGRLSSCDQNGNMWNSTYKLFEGFSFK
jgi:hypothetical protein